MEEISRINCAKSNIEYFLNHHPMINEDEIESYMYVSPYDVFIKFRDGRKYIYEQLENCVGLIFRQPMFADFEYKLHTMAENNEALSSKVITDLYAKLNQEYYGDDVVMDELVGWSCYYVPHFYYNYYVYKYTLGMTVALAIVSRLVNGDEKQKEAYLRFLKSGGSKDPVDLLKDALVNPLEDQLYDDAFHYFETILNEFENIILDTSSTL